jgi:hypothetical protein
MANQQYIYPNFKKPGNVNITTLETDQRPSVVLTDGTPLYSWSELGFQTPFELLPYIIHQYGRQDLRPSEFFTNIQRNKKRMRSYIGKLRDGNEVMNNAEVRATVTANGVALDTLVIDVAFEGGLAGNVLNVNQQIISLRNRNFQVIDITVVNGFQRATLVPTDGVANLRVVGNQSVDFPTTSLIGLLGRGGTKDGPGICKTFAKNYFNNYNERVAAVITVSELVLKKDQISIHNEVNRGRLLPFTAPNPTRPEDRESIVMGYFTESEAIQQMQMIAQIESTMLHGQRNVNIRSGAIHGSGLDELLPFEQKWQYTPASSMVDMLFQAASNIRINCLGVTELDFYPGEGFYEPFMAELSSRFPNMLRTEPYYTEAERERQQVTGPNRYKSFIDVFGTRVNIYMTSQFNRRDTTARRAPNNPNLGIRAYDAYLVNAGPMTRQEIANPIDYVDTDLMSLDYVVPIDYDGTDLEFIDVYRSGLIDENGKTITSGPVNNLEAVSTRVIQHRGGILLADPLSVIKFEIAA